MANACRHFLGLFPGNRPSCSQGWNVREWAVRCNGGSEFGIALRLPCTKMSDGKPLFDCPSLDRKTDEQVAKERAEMSAHMDRVMSAMPKLAAMKRKMVANSLTRVKATCPWCEERDALKVTCAIGVNNHIHARCKSCGEGIME